MLCILLRLGGAASGFLSQLAFLAAGLLQLNAASLGHPMPPAHQLLILPIGGVKRSVRMAGRWAVYLLAPYIASSGIYFIFVRPSLVALCSASKPLACSLGLVALPGPAVTSPDFPLFFLVHVGMASLGAALVEETFFRGYLLAALRARWGYTQRGRLACDVGQATLFGLAHVATSLAPLRFLTALPGYVLGRLACASGCLLPPIMLHVTCNMTASLVLASAKAWAEP